MSTTMTTASNTSSSSENPHATADPLPSTRHARHEADPPHPFAVLPRRVPSSTASSSKSSSADCPIDEIIQYQCQMHRNEVVCVPLVRLFRRCPGMPSVEITPEYDRLGRPVVPPARSPWIDPDVAEVKHRSPMFHKVSQAEAQAREEPSDRDASRRSAGSSSNSGVRWGGSRTSHEDEDHD